VNALMPAIAHCISFIPHPLLQSLHVVCFFQMLLVRKKGSAANFVQQQSETRVDCVQHAFDAAEDGPDAAHFKQLVGHIDTEKGAETETQRRGLWGGLRHLFW
jgi:hypothetical protein